LLFCWGYDFDGADDRELLVRFDEADAKREFANMSLADVFEKVKSGVFHIVFLDAGNNRVGSGTAFSTCGYLVTNHHVFSGPRDTRVWIRRETHKSPAEGVLLSYPNFERRLRSGSDRNNFDFAILDFPELASQPATVASKN
jgi:hypothetical protein